MGFAVVVFFSISDQPEFNHYSYGHNRPTRETLIIAFESLTVIPMNIFIDSATVTPGVATTTINRAAVSVDEPFNILLN